MAGMEGQRRALEHLDAESWRALQARAPHAVVHFREHLRTPCATCQDFLAVHWGGDALEGAVDAALLSLAPSPPPAAVDEAGWERVRRQLPHVPGASAGRTRAGGRRAWAWAAAPAALATLLALVVLLPRSEAPEQGLEEGVKGLPPLALELSAAARTPGGELRPVAPDQRLSPGDVLLFRYHASGPGTAALVRVEGGRAEQLGTFALQPGTHELSAGEGLVGAPLSDARGAVTFVLVARPGTRPPTPREVDAALFPEGGTPSQLSASGVRVHVESR